MSRYKITLKYNGSNYFGWQVQSQKRTVQAALESALSPLNKSKRVNVYGAGRTDTGVHALGQIAHFDLSTNLNEIQLLNAINARLPLDIRVNELALVSDDFHARFSAKRRHYRYQCYLGDNLLFNNQAWQLDYVNVRTLNKFAKIIVGENDFLSFSKLNKQLDNTICNIYQSKWIKNENMLTFNVCGNRFLHHMVRYLVGTMIAGVEGKISIGNFTDLLKIPQKNVKIFKAPPQGLILMGIEYD